MGSRQLQVLPLETIISSNVIPFQNAFTRITAGEYPRLVIYEVNKTI